MVNVNKPPTEAGKLDIELAWDILKELGSAERHFNTLEAEYRKLASIWLLAGFAGMGFILKENPAITIPPEVIVFAIGVATSIGILLLWIVDLLVYHRLLNACFEEALRIEKSHLQLPQVRSGMKATQGESKVVTTRLRWFYIALTAAPIIFAAPILVLWCRNEFGVMAAFIAGVASAAYVAIISLTIWLKVSSKETN